MSAQDDHGYGTWIVPDVNPMPWTSPEATIGRRGGKLVPQVHQSQRVKGYQEELREYLERSYDCDPLDYDITLRLWFWRQLGGTNRRADATNLQKSTEDALHGLLFLNDSQVRRVTSVIVQQTSKTNPGLVIEWEMFVVTEADMEWDDAIKILNGDAPAVQPRENMNVEDYF
jgi:Holliday junction resolvase RusA-like endonuclease